MGDKSIAALLGTFYAFKKYLKPDTPLRRLHVFTYVAENEPVTLAEVAKRLGIPQGTAYEDLRALGPRDVYKKPGALLLLEHPGQGDDQAHRYCLSVRGTMLRDAISLEVQAAFLDAEEGDEPLEEYFASVRHRRG